MTWKVRSGEDVLRDPLEALEALAGKTCSGEVLLRDPLEAFRMPLVVWTMTAKCADGDPMEYIP